MTRGLAFVNLSNHPAALLQFVGHYILNIHHRNAVQFELGGVAVVIVHVGVLLLVRGVVAVELAYQVLNHHAVLNKHRVDDAQRFNTAHLIHLTYAHPVNQVVVVEGDFEWQRVNQIAIKRAILNTRQIIEVGTLVLGLIGRAAHQLLTLVDGNALVDSGAVVVDISMSLGVEVAVESFARFLGFDV